MWVTCYTDASFHRSAGGTWAVWVRSDRGRIVRSGDCPTYARDSVVAELSAIYAGIYLILREWGRAVRGIRIRSDCQGALALAAAPSERNVAARRLHQKIHAIAKAHGVELDLAWVKGHQPRKSGVRAWLNAECDRLARERLRQAARGAALKTSDATSSRAFLAGRARPPKPGPAARQK